MRSVQRDLVKVRAGKSGEVSLPNELHKELGIKQGDASFYIVVRDDGVIELGPEADEVNTSTRSKEWHERQRQAQRELAAGRGTVHEDGEALIAHLKSVAGG